jgi:hypothetical protein
VSIRWNDVECNIIDKRGKEDRTYLESLTYEDLMSDARKHRILELLDRGQRWEAYREISGRSFGRKGRRIEAFIRLVVTLGMGDLYYLEQKRRRNVDKDYFKGRS